MSLHSKKEKYNKICCRAYIALGVAINVILAYVMFSFDLPLFLDTPGTLIAAGLGGPVFGVFTAMITNVVCVIFNRDSLYFSIINVILAMCYSGLIHSKKRKSMLKVPMYITIAAFVSGILGIAIQWLLLGGPQNRAISEMARVMAPGGEANFFLAAMIVNIGLNFVDKTISVGIAFTIDKLIPQKHKKAIQDSGWKQRPLSETDPIQRDRLKGRTSFLRRIVLMLLVASLSLVIIMSFISIRIYSDEIKEDYTHTAESTVEFAADVIDPEMIEEYIKKDGNVPGYEETKELLYKIRENAPGVKYLYALKIEERGCIFIFDLDYEDEPGYKPGEVVPWEDVFEPYMDQLLAGEEIEPVESNLSYGWVLTVYKPLKDKDGKTVCYVGADVSMPYVTSFTRTFLWKSWLIFAGFFVLILEFGTQFAEYNLVYPITSMTACAKGFVESDGEQTLMDTNVKAIRDLDISTSDELEELYKAVCRMEADMAEQVRDIRYYADATAKMQNGLIITMADMVENRDSDTGAHVQKTAAYVRIILNGLKRKGYYAEKLTPKYMADVEMSAPLHDVGKIHISDAILNKPGKLTQEEFNIMKTHTTAGKDIMENAISTVKGENYLKEARNMAAYHHERWDGKGYPEGLHGEVIPLSARIMAVADVFDALTSSRVYKPPFSVESAFQTLKEGAGKQFDPKCVEVFLESSTEVKRVLMKYNRDIRL